MGQKRHTEEQIIEILRDGETGLSVAEVCRKHAISDATYYKWKKRYGGVEKTELRRLRELEQENGELKKALGEHVLVVQTLKEHLKKRGWD